MTCLPLILSISIHTWSQGHPVQYKGGAWFMAAYRFWFTSSGTGRETCLYQMYKMMICKSCAFNLSVVYIFTDINPFFFSLQVVYYIFAMVGMELFKGKIQYFEPNSTTPGQEYCGNPLLKGTTFAKLNYCKNNFNNVVSSFIVLLELTVVNQWHDILYKWFREKVWSSCVWNDKLRSLNVSVTSIETVCNAFPLTVVHCWPTVLRQSHMFQPEYFLSSSILSLSLS